MKPDSKDVLEALNAAYEKKDQENAEFIRNADISIFIKVSKDYDHYSLADYIDDILDDIPAVDDVTMFID